MQPLKLAAGTLESRDSPHHQHRWGLTRWLITPLMGCPHWAEGGAGTANHPGLEHLPLLVGCMFSAEGK